MKKIKTVMLFIILGLLLVGCGTKMAGNDASIADSSNVPNEEMNDASIADSSNVPNEEMDSDSAMELVNIVDLTIVNHLGTDEELEEFYKDSDYTYYFPSIKSEYIECQFSNGDKMNIVEALNSKKVVISDLDIYNIQYWIVDKDGNYINSREK